MSKKRYNGLEVKFVSIAGTDIVAASPKECEQISTQYYFLPDSGESTCVTEVYEEGAEEGYSLNWNQAYPGWQH